MKNQINIVEHFYTIQGEGLFCGTPSYFIRMSICPLRCSFCDSKFTWKRTGLNFTIEELHDKIVNYPCKHIVITGGEPFYHTNFPNLVKMVSFFLSKAYIVTIETTGIQTLEQLYTGKLTNNIISFLNEIPDTLNCNNIYFSVSPKFNLDAYSEVPMFGNECLTISTIYNFYNFINWMENLDGAKMLQKINRENVYFKFVYYKDTHQAIEFFIKNYIPEYLYSNIFVMPQTSIPINPEEEKENKKMTAEFCKANGVRYSPRIHIDVWGLQKGK